MNIIQTVYEIKDFNIKDTKKVTMVSFTG